MDTGIFHFINRTCANPVFDILMPLMSELGSGEGIFIMSFLVLALAKKEKKRSTLILWAGLTLTYYVSSLLKDTFARPRPCAALPDVRLVMGLEKSFSFPSTHAMQSFMAATVMARYFSWGAALFGVAALVAFSRVYIGVHYASDVLAGAVLGTLLGYILVRLFKKDVE
jgi:undecaprenyl-diphosphatase